MFPCRQIERELGMKRLVSAFFNSVRAFRRLASSEAAFQQELILLVLALPIGWFVAASWKGYALLIGVLLLLIVVEVLNTGIEAACDAVSREFNAEIQFAKDCGSLAVLITALVAASVWGIALIERITGVSL
jgi:diacylglycerol kinase (ATP)